MELKDKNLYYVGGVVRDEILCAPSFDVDFCYEGDAIEFARVKGLNVIKTNPDFGTVRVLFDEQEIDIASTRKEIYPKAGHLPVVSDIGCPLKDDLSRRDFTINAMAKNTLTGEIVDYFGGLEDIKDKKLRVLHEKSFIDDPTRILRALKFAVRFGFDLDKDTKKLQDEYLRNINYDISYHRLKKELKETFNLNREIAFERFVKDGIYKMLGEGQIIKSPLVNLEDVVKKYEPEHIWLVYLGLFNLKNLELTSDEMSILTQFNEIKKSQPKDDYEIYKMFKNKPLESILLYLLFINKDIAEKFLDVLSDIKILITGDDLMRLGIPQGKVYKEIFDALEEEKVSIPTMTYEDEIAFVKSKYRLFI